MYNITICCQSLAKSYFVSAIHSLQSNNWHSPGAIEEEVRILVEETKTPKTADELLNAYAGREKELLKNLRKLKAAQDRNVAIRAEVSELCQKVNASISLDGLLESYKGREDDLLKNLRRLSFKQQVRYAFVIFPFDITIKLFS